MPDYRSVSQVSDLEKCGWAYYLSRVEKKSKRPAAWLPQGTAFHEAAEKIESAPGPVTLAQATEWFSEAYDREIGRLGTDEPNLWAWFPSGPYKGEIDIPRRYGIGVMQIESYMRYREKHPEEKIVTLGDNLAVELAFKVHFGDVEVRGFIDQVVEDGEGAFARDLKTGKKPGSDFQLGTYAKALLLQYGLDVLRGDYWMAQSAKPTGKYDLSGWSVERLADRYGEADAKIRAEEFEPNPSRENCMFCDVAKHCEYREE
jgi:putative RecB family exonuclease